MKPKLVSNAQVFAKQGNPWVSEREGREKYGRNLLSENPDMDQWTSAAFAPRKPNPFFQIAGVDITPLKPEKEVDEAKALHRRAQTAAIRVNMIVNSRRVREVKESEGADKVTWDKGKKK